MRNKNNISEMIEQAKQIEDNNISNIKYTNNINSLAAFNDLAPSEDSKLNNKLNRLNKHMEDISQLTSDLLDDLRSRHN